MNGQGPGPCIVMAHGLGGIRQVALPAYARAFADAGYCVLSFDYRCWGESEGEPRELVSIRQQLQDWQNAIAYARTLPTVDPSRVALWGTSFSGGHVIVITARDHTIAAVAAQCPMMDGTAAALHYVRYAGLWLGIQLATKGILDLFRAIVGRSPVYVPTIAAPGSLGLMSSRDAETGFNRLLEASEVDNYQSRACARFALIMGMYRPIRYAKKVTCPTLIIVCNNDSVAPSHAAVATAERIGSRAQLIRSDLGHFDIYLDHGFRFSVEQHLQFFRSVLPVN
jgi:pimeloyl-ACP methyl ester carboxylesterase